MGRADEYALAATAYHLLTASRLFPHSIPAVVISRHLNSPPPAVADMRPELAALDRELAIALTKNPQDRFSRCTDFARALASARDQVSDSQHHRETPFFTPARFIADSRFIANEGASLSITTHHPRSRRPVAEHGPQRPAVKTPRCPPTPLRPRHVMGILPVRSRQKVSRRRGSSCGQRLSSSAC